MARTLGNETDRLAKAFAGPNSLASAVEYRTRRNGVRNYVISPATALAASVMLWIMFGLAQEPQKELQTLEQVMASATVPTVPPPVTPSPKAAPRVAPALVRLQPSPPIIPVPVQAVAVAASARKVEPASPDLQVDPEAGTLATIMRGRNPNVTVVWLTK